MRGRRIVTTVIAGLVLVGLASGPAVSGEATEPGPVTSEALLSAWVPSLCEHPAGYLVNGELPGIEPHSGGVWLAEEKLIALGEVTPDSPGDAAAVVRCNQGGVGWPDNVIVYDPALEVVGTFRLMNITKGGRESVEKIDIRDGQVHVRVTNIAGTDDPACCASKEAALTMAWSDDQDAVTLVRKKVFSERRTAVRFRSLVAHGKTERARRFGSLAAVRVLRRTERHGRTSLQSCHGTLSGYWPTWADADTLRDASRVCLLDVKWDDGPYASLYGLLLEHHGWRDWKVVNVVGIAG